jgi:plastocyanin
VHRKKLLVTTFALFMTLAVAVPPALAGGPATFRAQLDARPPSGESWAFLRIFPRTLSVHQNDIVDAAWNGSAGTPHTATIIPDGNANAWRAENQGPGGPQDPGEFPWAVQVPDQLVGGDDNQVDLNPAVAAPTDPSCGTVSTPCTFDASGVVNSGFQFSSPGSQPSFFVQVTAPVGSYTIACLIHTGMQLSLNVVAGGTTIPDPVAVAAKVTHQVAHARSVDGGIADDLAQTVKRTPIGGGRDRLTLWAGGFWNQVSADEYPDRTVRVHVGDRVRVLGNFEIHTATFPKSSASTVPFVTTQCEVVGPDTPAVSPADCAAPTDFQIAFNSTALLPTASSSLDTPGAFVNSGLLAWGSAATFVADQPGTYRFVCLVHGPSMSGTIRVRSG